MTTSTTAGCVHLIFILIFKKSVIISDGYQISTIVKYCNKTQLK